MSNPIDSLKKVKRVPLFLPEMSKNSTNSEEKNNRCNSKIFDLNMGYARNSPQSVSKSSRLAASFNKLGFDFTSCSLIQSET